MKKVVVGIISRTNANREVEYLLVSSKKRFGDFSGSFYPPGGHVKEGETKKEALKRELKEELNIDIEPVKEIAETSGDVDGQITYWWLCNITGGHLKINKKELYEAQFFSQNVMKSLKLWPATKAFFDKYLFG
jgi:8-oxo-dGTP pyrophosphatase MutT (NUDIX family)